MGIHYLWVDAFCIIQDDENDKAAQLQLMAEIYQYALFIVVAAVGNDAQAGLPGVSIPREAIQQNVLVKKAESPELVFITYHQGLHPSIHCGACSCSLSILPDKAVGYVP
ncbi:hypothetical protein B0H65DRAFT_466876 [Neurospora tetraspora]|uniref:Heterokaryon incompatibility domain-containing protein n=1 Tax=Neurospora tetraspora TaxID=94610 RepID=A0AAE0MRX8_9PEZI|nr:hypothetical protein B0H65DRAFT_466876 [Neurospora tetraspora]